MMWGGPGLTTWFLEGVGQMTIFDHDGGREDQNFRKCDHVIYGCPLSSAALNVLFAVLTTLDDKMFSKLL